MSSSRKSGVQIWTVFHDSFVPHFNWKDQFSEFERKYLSIMILLRVELSLKKVDLNHQKIHKNFGKKGEFSPKKKTKFLPKKMFSSLWKISIFVLFFQKNELMWTLMMGESFFKIIKNLTNIFQKNVFFLFENLEFSNPSSKKTN